MEDDRPEVMEPVDEDYTIPLRALLSRDTERRLIQLLDQPCFKLATRCPLSPYADFRGAAVALGYDENALQLKNAPSPTLCLLQRWQEDLRNKRPATLGTLLELLLQLERYDIVYQIQDGLVEDKRAWKEERMRFRRLEASRTVGIPAQVVPLNRPTDVLMDDDGLTTYDAVFSYDTNSAFAKGVMTQMFDVLSRPPYSLSLCEGVVRLKMGTFQMEGFMTLVESRCRRVIVLLTNEYLKSDAYNFQLLFAKMRDVSALRRKVIPVVCEVIEEMPSILVDVVCVNFKNIGERRECYRSICESVRQVPR